MSPEELKDMIFAAYFRQITTKYDLPHFPKEKFRSKLDSFCEVAFDAVFSKYKIEYAYFLEIIPPEIVFLNKSEIEEYFQWAMYREFHGFEHKRRQWTEQFFEDRMNPLLAKAIKTFAYDEDAFCNEFHNVIIVDEKRGKS